MGLDLIRPDPSRHGALRLTEAARPVLRGEAALTLRADTVAPRRRRAPRGAPLAQVAEEDEGLLAALKAKRRALADAAGVPAYVDLPRPHADRDGDPPPGDASTRCAGITGVGAVKLERFGADLPRGAHRRGARRRSTRPAAGSPAQPAGALFDRLQAAQVALARGADGRGKYLSCTAHDARPDRRGPPRHLDALERIQGMGPQKTERFGAAFLDILRGG